MTKFTYFFLFFLTISFVKSQIGCTDSIANNYDPSAVTNDGSCTYNLSSQLFQSRGSLASFANESSGLVFANGYLWTHNDSGNPSKIFKTDTNGFLLQSISITNFPNTDWEDITSDSLYLYIADCGNNNGTRTDLKILKIEKSQFLSSTAAVVNATAQAINFSYGDQTSFVSTSNTNFDCESLISIGNFLYLFTKNSGDLQTRVYKLSKSPGTYTISPYTSFNVNGKITGAAYNKQKNEAVLIGYLSSHKSSFLWYLNDFNGEMFFSGNKRRVELGNSTNDWQTEGIDYSSNNELFFSCETSYVPATLYRAYKNNTVSVGIKKNETTIDHISLYPIPANNILYLEFTNVLTKTINIQTIIGKVILKATSEEKIFSIDINELPSGIYFCTIDDERNNTRTIKFIKQ